MAHYTKEQALQYHEFPRRGKIEVIPCKPCFNQKDLSLAYSPGVAEACMEICKNPQLSYAYTAKGNLVAVASNGTAVLGLGNIGPLAGKPVMEGKAILFKTFADVDAFDINIATENCDEFINTIKLLEPTFGGINLEDIKAPDCFYIEERLKKTMNIPVFHDDQHGTAIISGAALINACELTDRKLTDIKVTVAGAGAAGIACAKFYTLLGVPKNNIFMFDSKGLIHSGRTDINAYKREFAQDENKTLEECIKNSDVFLGLSKKGLLTQKMVQSMNEKPIIFALANPDPEITYEEAKASKENVIIGTGRSDYPNQINNVSGFPYIFRGALDVRATEINDTMKLAAAKALAGIAQKTVPQEVLKAYNLSSLSFGCEYILPKPFDKRILTEVTCAVAKAAMETGVAALPIEDFEEYKQHLLNRVHASLNKITIHNKH